MDNIQFNANINSMRSFILSTIIEEQGVVKTSVGDEKAKEIYTRLTPFLKEIFEDKEVVFHRVPTGERKELCAAFMDKDFDKVSEIVERSLLPKEATQKLSSSWESVSGDMASRTFVVDNKGESGATTNPVLFYSEEGKLSTYFPKDLLGVMKARLSKGIDYNRAASGVYKAFIDHGYGIGNPPSKAVATEILEKAFPDVYLGNVFEESDVFENQVIDAFKKIPTGLGAFIKEMEKSEVDHEQKAQELFKNFIDTGFSDENVPSESDAKAVVSKLFPEVDKSDSEKLVKAFTSDFKQMMKGYSQWKESSNIGDKGKSQLMQRSAGIKTDVMHEIKARGTAPIGQEMIRDRYINTALFAKEVDRICGTSLTPELSSQEVTVAVSVEDKGQMKDNIRGIFQEKMVFIPLAISNNEIREKYEIPEGNEPAQFVQKSFDLIGPYLDTESYQRAVIRETELADADLHSGNVALVPKLGEKAIPAITRFNPVQMQVFLEAMNQAKKTGNVDGAFVQKLREELIIGAIKKVGTSELQAKESVEENFHALVDLKDGQVPADLEIANKLAELAGLQQGPGLKFNIQLFDVDLTMPASNERGVTNGIPPVRNVLLAFSQANNPLTSSIRVELKDRREKMKVLLDSAARRFDDKTVLAFKEREECLMNAADENVMTPRGLVWRTFPAYAELEVAYDMMQYLDGEPVIPSEKYGQIGFKTSYNGLVEMVEKFGPPINIPDNFPVNISVQK